MLEIPEYKKLIEHTKKAVTLASCANLLYWDQQTYMPQKGNQHRSEQLSLLAGMIHELNTDPNIEQWLNSCENSDIDKHKYSKQYANIRELRRNYDRATKVPKQLIEELTKARSVATSAWEEARKLSDFSFLEPYLKSVVKLTIDYAEAVGYDESPYDALLDIYEPGLKTSQVNILFSNLKDNLISLVDNISKSCDKVDTNILKRFYPIERQRLFVELVASKLGFDFNAGRLDIVSHPFSIGIGPCDTRITTRWNENSIDSGLFSAIHEVGHALYEQGIEKELWGTPIGSSCSYGISESQARLWENCIGHSVTFWSYFFPILKATFPTVLDDVELDQFIKSLNYVNYSLSRIGSDEVTYNLHIIMRYEIEVALITGAMNVSDLPDAWNEKTKNLLKLDVPNDSLGCLQDAHWPDGDFGYFPTYTLGNMYAAQFYCHAKSHIVDFEKNIAQGNFEPLLCWLQQNIYKYGARYRPNDLVKRVTGKALNLDFLLSYLRERYLG